eukprot:TRINITY_DN1397_c0_g3_i1.p1 TRINITY_DN1397_c0_g3~~TRINITY_DN1397_c0_g3_i1.p1  ORF type:complete len:536 (-),score=138.67 TRINITY_DN1397_c0_g3_i1:62-1669(-)
MSQMMQPTILLLKEGTDTSQGIPHLISNINACEAIVETIKTTLGPSGMDKLIYEGPRVTISNDGATILKQLEIVHPAAKTLVEIAKSQDEEVGDGTTSVVILAGGLLTETKNFIEEGVHPQVIIKGYRAACELAKEHVKKLAIKIDFKDKDKRRQMLERCAATALNSKLVSTHKEFFSHMVVDACLVLGDDLDINMIGIKKEKGGTLEDSLLVQGVGFKKTFSYAGFEQQPKTFEKPKILLLNVELELKAEKDNASIVIKKPEEYQSFVDAEWNIIFEKLENCVKTGAKIVLSRLAIGDLATQYFADRDIFCAGRVTDEDLRRVSQATGGKIQTTTNNLDAKVLGTCGLFEERQIGKERYNLFTGCPESKTATLILRGGGDEFIDEAERSLHDAIMIVRRTIKHGLIVAGGGAIEMEIGKLLHDHSRTIAGKEQLIFDAFGKALENIPRQLAINGGFDCTDILNQLRKKHVEENGQWFGVDYSTGSICNTYESFVWEPALIKLNAITAATEAACIILSVDETIRSRPKGGEEAEE